jgi:hypothetical protein
MMVWIGWAATLYLGLGVSFGLVTILGRVVSSAPGGVDEEEAAAYERETAHEAPVPMWRTFLILLAFRAVVWPYLLLHYVALPREEK